MKVQDLRYVAAYRTMANDYRINAVLEITSLRKSLSLKEQELQEVLRREAAKEARAVAVAERSAQLESQLMNCAKKRERLKIWANIGKVGVVTVGVAAAGLIYTRLQ